MTNDTQRNSLADIPKQTFQAFLERLEAGGVSADIVDRLRKAEAGGQLLSEVVIREALFNDGGQTP